MDSVTIVDNSGKLLLRVLDPQVPYNRAGENPPYGHRAPAAPLKIYWSCFGHHTFLLTTFQTSCRRSILESTPGQQKCVEVVRRVPGAPILYRSVDIIASKVYPIIICTLLPVSSWYGAPYSTPIHNKIEITRAGHYAINDLLRKVIKCKSSRKWKWFV